MKQVHTNIQLQESSLVEHLQRAAQFRRSGRVPISATDVGVCLRVAADVTFGDAPVDTR